MNHILNTRQLKFAEFVLQGLSQSEAYKKAGYKVKNDEVAKSKASRLVTNGNVVKYIQDRQAEINEKLKATTQVTKERIVAEFAKVAFAIMSDFAEIVGGVVSFKDFKDLTPEQLAAVAEVAQTTTKDGGSIRLKLHSKIDALRNLGEQLGIYPPRGVDVGITKSFEDFLKEQKP